MSGENPLNNAVAAMQVQTALDNANALVTINAGALIQKQAEVDILRATLNSGWGGLSSAGYAKDSFLNGKLV